MVVRVLPVTSQDKLWTLVYEHQKVRGPRVRSERSALREHMGEAKQVIAESMFGEILM